MIGEQLFAFLVLLPTGIVSGIVFEVFNFFKRLTKKNFIVVIIADIFGCLITGLLFIICVFKYNYGSFALFEIVSFVLGILIEQFFVQNLFAKPILWVYNKLKIKKN